MICSQHCGNTFRPTIRSSPQLQPYFESPLDNIVLQRWKVAPADEVPNVRLGDDWVVTQKSPVDEDYDS